MSPVALGPPPGPGLPRAVQAALWGARGDDWARSELEVAIKRAVVHVPHAGARVRLAPRRT